MVTQQKRRLPFLFSEIKSLGLQGGGGVLTQMIMSLADTPNHGYRTRENLHPPIHGYPATVIQHYHYH